MITATLRTSRDERTISLRAISMVKSITLSEIRAIVEVAEHNYAGFFAEYLAKNVSQIDEDIDIIRGAFVRRELTATVPDLHIHTEEASGVKSSSARQLC